MSLTLTPAQCARAASAYRALLRAQRLTFKGDELALKAAHQQTRILFNRFIPSSSASRSPFAPQNPLVPPSQLAPKDELTPDKVDEHIDGAFEIAKFLRTNVVQGVRTDEGNYASANFQPNSPGTLFDAPRQPLLERQDMAGVGENGLGSPASSPTLSLKGRANELKAEDSLLGPPRSSVLSAPSLTTPQVSLLGPDSSPSTALFPPIDANGIGSSVTSALAGRPRAGTLPSTFHLRSSAAPSSSGLRSALAAPDALLAPSAFHNGTTSLPGSGPTTPLEQPFGSALLQPSSSAASQHRLRSGSLTLPPSSLSSAFGPGVFSSADWTTRTDRSGSDPTTRLSTLASDPRSPDESSYGDDSHVRTLDYLGLAEETSSSGGGTNQSLLTSAPLYGTGVNGRSNSLSGPLAPPMQRLGSTGSIQPAPSALGDFAAHQRLRSHTVASAFPPRFASDALSLFHSTHPSASYPSSVAGHSPAVARDDPFNSSPPQPYHLPAHPLHRPSSSSDHTRLLYATAASLSDATTPPAHAAASVPAPAPPLVSLLPPQPSPSFSAAADHPNRGRSASIGIFEDSKGEMIPRRRAGTTAGIPPRHLGIGASPGQGPVAAMASRMGRLSISVDSGASGWGTSGGAVSLSPPVQQPTRSLWVGNLDPKTTPAELQEVFAPYGAIESLRLIPEKECGFVNFVSVADAMRAKEDVLNRLGGQLTKTSGLVRIGYGKAESTPAPTAPGLVHPRSTAGPAPVSAAEMNLQTQPTRALWIGSIPPTTTPNHLLAVFSSFGPIESARVLTHKSCGFVNFERLDDAVAARKSLNNREILGAEVGPVRIGFAKVPTKVSNAPFANQVNGDGTPATSAANGIGSYPHVYNALSQLSGVSNIPVERQLADGQMQDYRSNMVLGLVGNSHYATAHSFQQPSPAHGQPVETHKATINEMQLLMRELSQGDPELEAHVAAVGEERPPIMYYTSIPLAVLNDPRFARRYSNNDAPRVREIRKRLESELPTDEVDEIAQDLLDEIVPLASDYLGNTLVQKLFEQTSTPVRKAMLERIAPHLAPIGTHKNGTWAVQKVIQCAQDEDEYALIQQSLTPYTPPLLLNDFGNYVVQGALRFGSPYADFVFDAMVDRIWEIGSGRFGARSTRQTLENPESPRLHVKRVAASIVLNAIPLATSSNGALLITWFLESSDLPNRYSLLAPRFAPHLSHLCTHKLASQSIMRVINQHDDDEAQRIMIEALLDPDAKVLEDILGDQMHGTACIQKVTSSTHLTVERRQYLFDRIKEAIASLKVEAVPAYRKLIEEVGGTYLGPPAGNTPPYTPGPLPHHGSRGPARSPAHGSAGPPHSYAPSRRVPSGHQQFVPPQIPYPQAPGYGAAPPYPTAYSGTAPYSIYPPPPFYGGPAPPSQFGSPFSPPFGHASPPSSHAPSASSPAVSPMMAHPGLHFSPGIPPRSTYPSISSPDPLQALRVASSDFNPAFSPLASPPPPFYAMGSFGTFAAQQDAPGGPFDAHKPANG
ncbi:RNA binding protein Jsn1 [Rhodotorula toruloides]|uniref:RNA binding protein Jsn1 n=1 Tax=Rhodotorula toruloides TaxID=5286 RepID=A0A511KH11_RHOTO|nr:RNA binding protein Jsn1 [Rhodotorula toruloides]